MKNLFLKVLTAIKNKWFCCHQWKIFREVSQFESENSKRPYKITYTLYCTKCGKFKRMKV